METTVGQLLINEALPEDLRDYKRVYDKKSIRALFEQVADRHPDEYADITQKLQHLAGSVAMYHGRQASLSLAAFKTPTSVRKLQQEVTAKVEKILAGKGTTDEKHSQIVETVADYIDPITDANMKAGIQEKNPLAMQVLSGSRGNPTQFRKLRGGPLLVVDHKDRPIPIPMLASYSDGMDPVQYWAGAYGSRKGEASKKLDMPKAGYLGKQLAAAAHRLIVTEKDCGTTNGIRVAADDPDNEGAVLAADSGKFKAGDIITPRHFKNFGGDMITVRSPMTCQAEQGVCQRCAGVRERGGFPPLGDNLGIAAAQAVSEPVGQGQMQVRHLGGMMTSKATTAKSGLELINQLVQVPKTFAGGAAVASLDGRVEKIEDAPQGGKFIYVGGEQHWVPEGQEISVKKGQEIEAGDVMSSGIPNPALVVQHKGIGEGRRQFVDIFRKALKDSNFTAHRRNLEILSRGLINHVRITDLDGPADTVPDDLTEYDGLVRGYQPRYGSKMTAPKQALGLYLEKPVLHYSIGTKVTPRVAKALDEGKIPHVLAHPDEPSFAPEMSRAMETLANTDDWMVRLGGLYGVKRSVLKGVHRGLSASEHGTSFVPALAKGTEFGKGPEALY